MKLLYVTTFNKKLYNLSGKNLIKTFLEKTKFGKMLVCYEDMEFESDSDRILSYNINQSNYFNKWLKDNENNIPELYGGKAKNKDPRFLEDKKKGQHWARFRASKYFRKIVALNYFLEKYQNEYDFVILIDSDCILKKNIDENLINNVFKDNSSMIYFWGRYRRKKINRGPETGFTVYSKINNGYKFAKIICDCFGSGDFLRYEYWDDGYVIGRLICENKNKFKFKDLITTGVVTTRVMELPSPFFDYVHHFKNLHKFDLDNVS